MATATIPSWDNVPVFQEETPQQEPDYPKNIKALREAWIKSVNTIIDGRLTKLALEVVLQEISLFYPKDLVAIGKKIMNGSWVSKEYTQSINPHDFVPASQWEDNSGLRKAIEFDMDQTTQEVLTRELQYTVWLRFKVYGEALIKAEDERVKRIEQDAKDRKKEAI